MEVTTQIYQTCIFPSETIVALTNNILPGFVAGKQEAEAYLIFFLLHGCPNREAGWKLGLTTTRYHKPVSIFTEPWIRWVQTLSSVPYDHCTVLKLPCHEEFLLHDQLQLRKIYHPPKFGSMGKWKSRFGFLGTLEERTCLCITTWTWENYWLWALASSSFQEDSKMIWRSLAWCMSNTSTVAEVREALNGHP